MHKESEQIIEALQQVIHGKKQILQSVWITLLAGGHILLEDLPGVGKTTLAKSIGQVLNVKQQRVQLTPDTMASDITGFMLFNQQTQSFELKKGAVMTNILLADELNRTSSRTQAALLEAMQEKQVTVDEVTYELPKPYHVIATQNPTGTTGTQPLPLAQLDRFMTRLSLGYPDTTAQVAMLKQHHQLQSLQAIATKEQFELWQEEVNAVSVADSLYLYVTHLVEATRKHSAIQYGISPRGALALCQYARARAFYFGRTYVLPEDIMESFVDVCNHRIVLKTAINNSTEILQQIINEVPSPDTKAAIFKA